ncbi:hypothetical protein NS226_10715 [Aureimonas ureilytica]|uniref:Peptidase M10 serralysin C-terminal domain-containing protein n=2 Tax=Aureimonas ureilytica TaxID=401562 RepID=A0A175R8L5_9HYPH|nr:hypothetical protein NS226_10715 [Aureimonas ureilytica]
MLDFNASFYLQQNPDVAFAISRGVIASAEEHFNTYGRFEGRNPNAYFDVTYYLTANPDVAAARVNPLEHFLTFGAKEGRFSNANFDAAIDSDGNNLANEFNAEAYLAANPDVADAVAAGQTTAFQHYAQFGQFESRTGATLLNGTVLTGPFATAGSNGTGGSNPGSIFTLTAAANTVTGGVDNVTGTAGNDTFRAVIAESFGSEDIINGGAGNDVLNISAGAIFGDEVNAVVSGIERINNADTATVNLSQTTGVEQIWSSAAGVYTNASTSTVFGAENMTVETTVKIDYTGTATSAALAISNSNADGDVTFVFGDDAATIKSVSVAASAGNAGDVILDPNLDALENISVTGAGKVTIVSDEATLKNFDASANTGGVNFVAGDLTSDAVVKGSSGNDTLDFSAGRGTEKVTIDAGAGNDIIIGTDGNDIINGGAGNDIITGGLGADQLTGGAGNDVFKFNAVAESSGTTIDTITDFAKGDVLDFSAIDLNTDADGVQGFALTTSANQIAVTNAVSALASTAVLADALSAVEDVLTDGRVATFQFGGDTYVVGNVAGTSDDLVVRLTGTHDLVASDFTFA